TLLMKRNLLLSFFALAISSLAWSQVTTSSVSGTVVDSNGAPLPGATVLALHGPSGTQYGASTTVEGKFSIFNMRVGGPYSIEISFVGYQSTKVENVFLKLGDPLSLGTVTLQEGSTELGEVVVTANSFASDRTG